MTLLDGSSEGRRYRFHIGPKETLPATIVVAACLDYADRLSPQSNALALSRLAHDPGSPGRVFKLSEAAIAEAIEQVTRRQGDHQTVFLSDGAGLLQFQYVGQPARLSASILDGYFAARGAA